jgi:hypothetical protein
MTALLEDMAAYYSEHADLATKFTGSSDADEAAWTILASTLLNLDQVVTK